MFFILWNPIRVYGGRTISYPGLSISLHWNETNLKLENILFNRTVKRPNHRNNNQRFEEIHLLFFRDKKSKHKVKSIGSLKIGNMKNTANSKTTKYINARRKDSFPCVVTFYPWRRGWLLFLWFCLFTVLWNNISCCFPTLSLSHSSFSLYSLFSLYFQVCSQCIVFFITGSRAVFCCPCYLFYCSPH